MTPSGNEPRLPAVHALNLASAFVLFTLCYLWPVRSKILVGDEFRHENLLPLQDFARIFAFVVF